MRWLISASRQQMNISHPTIFCWHPPQLKIVGKINVNFWEKNATWRVLHSLVWKPRQMLNFSEFENPSTQRTHFKKKKFLYSFFLEVYYLLYIGYRYRPIRKLDLLAVIGISRYGKKLIDHTLLLVPVPWHWSDGHPCYFYKW